MTTGTLHGRIALVTGGSRGIGAAIVRSLAQAGAAVAVNYRERASEANALVKAIGRCGRTCHCDRKARADPRPKQDTTRS